MWNLGRLCAMGAAGGLFCAGAFALDIAGASTIQPVVDKLIPLYTSAGGENVKLSAGGSGAGVKGAIAGTAQIGMVSRALKPDEAAALKHQTIGIDALAIIVHKDNPLTELSKQQLTDLYTGKIRSWRALGGADRPVVRISKEVGRSTLELFEHYTGLLSPDRPPIDGKSLISKDAFIIGSNLESLTLVGGMPGAVGYVSFGTAEALIAAGMPGDFSSRSTGSARAPHRFSIAATRSFASSTSSIAKKRPPVKAFMDLTLSDAGQAVVKSLGFLPVNAK